jgi:hypothetical protein
MPIGLVFVFLSLLLIKVHSFRNLLRIRPVGYFALWILGPLTFYFLAFIDKAGYLLVILAPIQIIIAKAILVVTSKLSNGHLEISTKVISIITNVALCIIWFVFPAQADGMPTKIERPASLHHPPMSDYNWDISHRAIVVEDNQMDIVSKLLSSQSLLGYGPQTTVLVYTDGKPRWRKLMYYFPEYYTYWLVDETNSGMPEFGTEVYVGYQGKEDSYSGLAFWLPGERPNIQVVCLPSKTQNILWFVSKHSVFLRELSNDSLISGYLRIDDSEWSLPYIHLDAMHTLTVGSFIFVPNEHVTGHKCQ